MCNRVKEMPLGLPFSLDPDICVSLLVVGTTRGRSTAHLSWREALCAGILEHSEVARGHQGGILARKAKQEVQDGPKTSTMEFVCKCEAEACSRDSNSTSPIKGDRMMPPAKRTKKSYASAKRSAFPSLRRSLQTLCPSISRV